MQPIVGKIVYFTLQMYQKIRKFQVILLPQELIPYSIGERMNIYKVIVKLMVLEAYFLGVADSDPLTYRVSSSNKSISMGPDGNVYYRGADNKIHRYYYTDGIWEHEWIDNTVPTLERVSGDIAVAPDGKIFYRGNDGFIQYYSFNVTIWQHFWIESNTADVSTKISSEPNSLAISNDNKVCYRGSNNKIHRYINSGDAYVHSQITVPFVDYQVKGNLQLGNNGEIYF